MSSLFVYFKKVVNNGFELNKNAELLVENMRLKTTPQCADAYRGVVLWGYNEI